MGELDGRAVVVTGAGNGLGAAYARAIAAAGGRVVVNDVDAADAARVAGEIISAGGTAVAHPADISDWTQADALIERCADEFGSVDGLVNNAGSFALALPQDQQQAPARRMIDVNLFGTVACGTHALRHMVSQGRGAVVNVTSAEQMGKTSSAVYGATKAAVAGLTYSWAADMQRHGVRVNAISPNAQTRMATIYQDYRGSAGAQNVGLAPEINAPLVVYLLSDQSSQVTGQVVRINGTELMLCTHPALLDPILQSSDWTVERIARAFTDDFGAKLQPVGVQLVTSQPVDPAAVSPAQ